jgi:hypothetical protein
MSQQRGWFGEWALLTKEWVIGAFCAATMDWMASKIPVRNGIFATLLSTAQLATTFVLVNAMRDFISGEKVTNINNFSDNWLLFNTIWMMSPTATNRMMGSYRKFHRILYGSATIPTTSAVACATGNC